MEIKDIKNKVKMILEYPKKIVDFGTLNKNDLDKLHLKVFLTNGDFIAVNEIKEITWAIKGEFTEKE